MRRHDRIGGDEFTMLIPKLRHADDALLVAHRIGDLMSRPFSLGEREVMVTASIGIALYSDEGIETDGQMRAMRELSCDSAQGYYFSGPIPVGELLAFLDQ